MNDNEIKAVLGQAGDDMPVASQTAVRASVARALSATPTSAPIGRGTVELRPVDIASAGSAQRHARRWVAAIGAGAIAAAAVAVFIINRDRDPVSISGAVPAPSSDVATTPADSTPDSPPDSTASTVASTVVSSSGATDPSITDAPPSTDPAPAAALPVAAVIPAGVDVTSVSFPTALDGWLVGTLSDGRVAFRRTIDGGVTWTEVIPPAQLPASDPANVGTTFSVSFADATNGWLVGSGSDTSNVLLATHDGGATWTDVKLSSSSSFTPMTIGTGAGMVHVMALVQDTDPIGFRMFTAPVDSDVFTVSPISIPPGAGPQFQVQMAFGGGSGWLVYNDRVLSGSARFADGAWTDWAAPCDGGIDSASVAASPDGSSVVVACATSGFAAPPYSIRIERSIDGGDTFSEVTPVPDGAASGDPAAGAALPSVAFVAQPAGDVIVVGYYASSSRGTIAYSSNGGATWTSAYDLGQEGSSTEFYAFDVTAEAHAPIVVVTGTGVGVVSNDDGATWTPLAIDGAPASGLAQIDLATGRLFGFDAGGLHGTNTPTADQFLAAAVPVLGEPDLDTGWYVVPMHPDAGGADCWGGATVRVMIWGDLSLLFGDDGTRQYLTNWQLGGTDLPARGIDLVVAAPAPHPSGLVTVGTAGDPSAQFGLGGSVAALAALHPEYAPRGAGGQVSGFGGLNNSMYVATGADGDTITRIAVENGC